MLEDNASSVVVLDGRRIGIIKSGSAYVKEGDLFAGWASYGCCFSQIAVRHDPTGLTPNRVGLLSGTNFSVNEGALGSQFTLVAGNAMTGITLGDGRMGFIDGSNNAWVKEGLNDGWTLESDSVSFLSLGGSGNQKRIGIIKNGTAYAKEGPLNAGWISYPQTCTKIRVNSGRVARLTSAGAVYANEGSLSAQATWLASNVSDVQLD